MSIPTSFCVDIVGKVILKGEAVVEILKVVEEKVNLFASSPIGTTIQDSGKRKRSIVVDVSDESLIVHLSNIGSDKC